MNTKEKHHKAPLIDIVYFESIIELYICIQKKTYTLTKKLFLSVKEEYLEKNSSKSIELAL